MSFLSTVPFFGQSHQTIPSQQEVTWEFQGQHFLLSLLHKIKSVLEENTASPLPQFLTAFFYYYYYYSLKTFLSTDWKLMLFTLRPALPCRVYKYISERHTSREFNRYFVITIQISKSSGFKKVFLLAVCCVNITFIKTVCQLTLQINCNLIKLSKLYPLGTTKVWFTCTFCIVKYFIFCFSYVKRNRLHNLIYTLGIQYIY